jgi:hypothetical protein
VCNAAEAELALALVEHIIKVAKKVTFVLASHVPPPPPLSSSSTLICLLLAWYLPLPGDPAG